MERLNEIIKLLSNFNNSVFGGYDKMHGILDKLNSLKDELVPTIPRFVADYIKQCKDYSKNTVYNALDILENTIDFEEVDNIYNWLYKDGDANEKEYIFVNAWFNGYKVEPEKRYIVRIPNPKSYIYKHTVLVKNSNGDVVIRRTDDDLYVHNRYQLTEVEIKEDFSWAWDLGFVEEVNEKE
ncbi:DUF1642 domain-containing protein [Streptococcus sp. sy010]|uniref:DUF1642 domain-containing protein n=1 Tax=Streptococcus sp. sy010 TaxID=2600148 RepID=UPI0011B6A92C|nr:DUF1642 domain-containing protein [Streptococcus sp. sy010]TWT16438.1 DUF1642 domain-containing protein [Streptococcus sp. sy010]